MKSEIRTKKQIRTLLGLTLIFSLLFVLCSGSSLALQPPNHPIPDDSELPSSNIITEGYIKISLLSPYNNWQTYPVAKSFRYDVESSVIPSKCTLIVSGQTVNESSSIAYGPNTLWYVIPNSPGDKTWRVRCEKSNLVNESALWNFKVLAAPIVPPPIGISLYEPKHYGAVAPGRIQFSYNLSNSTIVNKCELYVNGTRVNTTTPGHSNPQYISTYIAREYQGLYLWNMKCYNGTRTNATATRIVNVTTDIKEEETALLDISKDSYLPGSSIKVEGSLFTPSAQISFQLLRGGLVLDRMTFYATIMGTFTKEYAMPLNVSLDNYTFYAENRQNMTQNGSIDFEIAVPKPTLTFSKSSILPKEKVKIEGAGFIPDEKASLEIYLPSDTLNETIALNASSSGTFRLYYTPSEMPDANLTFYSYSDVNSLVNATGILEVKNPIPKKEEKNETEPEFKCPSTQVLIGGICCYDADSSGVCDSEEEETTPVLVPPTPTPPPIVDPTPSPITPPVGTGNVDEGGSGLMWILIVVGALVLIVGGFVGFVAYEGNLDISSVDGFIDGVKDSLGMSSSKGSLPPLGGMKSSGPPAAVSPGDFQMLSGFINGERSKGYDDLTIRNALLKKGWMESEVDSVFDKMYQ